MSVTALKQQLEHQFEVLVEKWLRLEVRQLLEWYDLAREIGEYLRRAPPGEAARFAERVRASPHTIDEHVQVARSFTRPEIERLVGQGWQWSDFILGAGKPDVLPEFKRATRLTWELRDKVRGNPPRMPRRAVASDPPGRLALALGASSPEQIIAGLRRHLEGCVPARAEAIRRGLVRLLGK